MKTFSKLSHSQVMRITDYLLGHGKANAKDQSNREREQLDFKIGREAGVAAKDSWKRYICFATPGSKCMSIVKETYTGKYLQKGVMI